MTGLHDGACLRDDSGLVALDLHQVLAARAEDLPSRVLLAVERVLAQRFRPDRLWPAVWDVEVAVLAVDAREALRLPERNPARRLGHPSHRQHWQIRSFPSTMGRVWYLTFQGIIQPREGDCGKH